LSTIIWTDHPHGHRLRIYKAVSAAVAHVKYRNGLSPVEKNHLALVKAADKGIRRAESEHASRVKQARKAVDKAAVPTKVQSLGRVRLTDEHLKTPNGQRPLTPDVQARVDTAGNRARRTRRAGPPSLLIKITTANGCRFFSARVAATPPIPGMWSPSG